MTKTDMARLCAWPLALMLPALALAADLTLAVTPHFAPEEIPTRVTPLKERLESALGKSIEIVVSSDFIDFEKKLKGGQIDISYLDPTLYPSAADTVEAAAMSSAGTFGVRLRGIVITRADSGIVSLEDLKGHSVSIVGLKSTGGYLSQKVTLEKEGIDLASLQIQEAIDNKQENVVLSVYYGDVDAGFIDEDALHIVDRYVPPNQIRVIQRTAWMPNWTIALKRSLPDALKTKLRDTLVGLKGDDTALKALGVRAFVPANDANYDVVRKAIGMAIPQR
jgi:phosphonate transport system substrate-binding protein